MANIIQAMTKYQNTQYALSNHPSFPTVRLTTQFPPVLIQYQQRFKI